MIATHQLFEQLDGRRSQLGMSKTALARRAAVSLPTIHRILSGRERRPGLETLTAVAAALGVEVRLSASPHVHACSDAAEFRREQARAKAKRLVRLVQGTMALEAEAVGADVLKRMEEHNFHALLAGPDRRLWGD